MDADTELFSFLESNIEYQEHVAMVKEPHVLAEKVGFILGLRGFASIQALNNIFLYYTTTNNKKKDAKAIVGNINLAIYGRY